MRQEIGKGRKGRGFSPAVICVESEMYLSFQVLLLPVCSLGTYALLDRIPVFQLYLTVAVPYREFKTSLICNIRKGHISPTA